MDYECLRCQSIAVDPPTGICPYCGRPALVPLGSESFINEDDMLWSEEENDNRGN